MDSNNNNPQSGNQEEKKTEQVTPATNTETTNESNEQEQKKMSWQIVLTIIAIIAIILIFALPSNNDEAALTTDVNEEEMVDEEGNVIETEEGTEPVVAPGTGNAAQSMSPVTGDEDFVYRFEGIEWFLEPVDGGTAVKFKFSEFSRREGSIVAFGNPYRLGVFAGECNEVNRLTFDTGTYGDTPLAYVTCREDAANGADIALFQDGANVYAMQRTITDGTTGEFGEFFSRDITTIVR